MELQCPICLFLALLVLSKLSSAILVVTFDTQEEQSVGQFIGNLPTAANFSTRYTDSQIDLMRFSFLTKPNENQNRFFRLTEQNGDVFLDAVIDRDSICAKVDVCQISLEVGVGPAEYFQIITVVITIHDINDHAPRFPQDDIEISILENVAVGSSIRLPFAVDEDWGSNGITRYTIQPQNPVFDLIWNNNHSDSPYLKMILKTSLDRETRDRYSFNVVAYDNGIPAKTASLRVVVLVGDFNDNSPKFITADYDVHIAENASNHTVITRVSASDDDIGVNAEIKYTFAPETFNEFGDRFHINHNTGEITLTNVLDHEVTPKIELKIAATDGGMEPKFAFIKITVHVNDINDNVPEIVINTFTNNQNAEVYENAKIDTFVAHLSIFDGDSGVNGQVACHLNSSVFALETLPNSQYKLVTAEMLDREKVESYHVSVKCQDNGDPTLATSQTLLIKVLDVNDNAPYFEQTTYTVSLKENNQVGMLLLEASATDNDIGLNQAVSYSLGEGPIGHLFSVNPNSGQLFINASLDYEQVTEYRFHVEARDSGKPRKSSSALVVVKIMDVNDEAPRFSETVYTFLTTENVPEMTSVGYVRATDADAKPYNVITYSLSDLDGEASSDTFSIDENGLLRARATLDREKRALHSFLVVARNVNVEPELSSSATVMVYVGDANDNSPVFTFPSHDNYTVHLSNMIGVGTIAATLCASDVDSAQNARLTYSIKRGNDDNAFIIDRATGEIIVNKDLSAVQEKVYNLTVSVSDNGRNRRNTTGNLYLVVNTSISITLTENTIDLHLGPLVENSEMTLIICIVTAACVTIIVLLVVILCVVYKRRKQLRPSNRFNAWETDRDHSSAKITGSRSSSDPEISQGSPPESTTSASTSPNNDRSYYTNELGDSRRLPSSATDVNEEDYQKQTRQALLRMLSRPVSHSTPNDEKQQLRKQRLMEFLKRDETDAESSESADSSNGDSGRSTLDDGDIWRKGEANMATSTPITRVDQMSQNLGHSRSNSISRYGQTLSQPSEAYQEKTRYQSGDSELHGQESGQARNDTRILQAISYLRGRGFFTSEALSKANVCDTQASDLKTDSNIEQNPTPENFTHLLQKHGIAKGTSVLGQPKRQSLRCVKGRDKLKRNHTLSSSSDLRDSEESLEHWRRLEVRDRPRFTTHHDLAGDIAALQNQDYNSNLSHRSSSISEMTDISSATSGSYTITPERHTDLGYTAGISLA